MVLGSANTLFDTARISSGSCRSAVESSLKPPILLLNIFNLWRSFLSTNSFLLTVNLFVLST